MTAEIGNVCPAPLCGKPIADTSSCCLRHWKMLPRAIRRASKRGWDITDRADAVWRESVYGGGQ